MSRVANVAKYSAISAITLNKTHVTTPCTMAPTDKKRYIGLASPIGALRKITTARKKPLIRSINPMILSRSLKKVGVRLGLFLGGFGGVAVGFGVELSDNISMLVLDPFVRVEKGAYGSSWLS